MIAKRAERSSDTLKHRNATTETITNNFERFNPYAAKALTCIEDDESQTFATLALAFELSQLRYQLSKIKLDDTAQKRVSSRA